MVKNINDSVCDCGFNVLKCQYFEIYRCVTGKHDSAYTWHSPFPVVREVLEE